MADTPDAKGELDLMVSQARIAAEMGDWDGARKELAQAIDATPNDPEMHALMAWYTSRARSLPDPERERLTQHHLDVALQINPKCVQAYHYRGLILKGQGNAVRARLAFQEALSIKPDYTPTLQALEVLDGRRRTISVVALPAVIAGERGAAHKLDRKLSVDRRKMLIAALVMVAGGGAGYLTMNRDPPTVAWASKLGTNIPIKSVDHVGKEMRVDIGDAWFALFDAERAHEMNAIAAGASKLGYDKVMVVSRDRVVAEVRNGRPQVLVR
jgi:tetratricopeptide (TPR) repeat protein